MEEHLGVLAAGEQQRQPVALGDDLVDHMERLGLEGFEMGYLMVAIDTMTSVMNGADQARQPHARELRLGL